MNLSKYIHVLVFTAVTTLSIGCTDTIKAPVTSYKNVNGAVYQVEELTSYDLQATGYHEIIINAKPEQVWATLTDFAAMRNWTTAFILTGYFADGNKVNIRHLVNGIVSDTQEIIQVEPNSLFSWTSLVPNLPEVSGKYVFAIEDTGSGKTRFVQSVHYQGSGKINNEVITARQLSETQKNIFDVFAQDLKKAVEKRH